MTPPTDTELLRDVATARSEAAFRQLLVRYLDLVYASAVRQVRDPGTAEDVAQATFLLLWQKADRLRDGAAALPAWLFTVVRLIARDANRRRRTRQQHEAKAAQMKPDAPAPDWDRLHAVLDAGLGDLSTKDRTAIVLRYLAGKTLGEVAAKSGTTEAAAKKRDQRAIGRLRDALARRGWTIRADVLATGLGATAIPVPPALLDRLAKTAAEHPPTVAQLARQAGRSWRLAQLRTAGAAAGATLAAATVLAAAAVWLLLTPVTPTIVAAHAATRPTPPTTAIAATDQDHELDLLEAGLATQLRLLSNLRVEATAHWERWDTTTKAWKPYGQSACAAWYDGRPGRNARIDYAEEVMPWTGGSGPFAWTVSKQAWDGQSDRRLEIELGTPDHRSRVLQRVEVRHERNQTYDTFDSGWSASTFGGDGNGRDCLNFVRGLRQASKTGFVHLALARVAVAGDRCLSLAITHSGGRMTTYFFDPTHGYAYRGCEVAAGQAHIRQTVVALAEPAPGLFYPARATDDRTMPGEGHLRATFEASTVDANNPAFDPKVFQLLPPGVPVYDMDAPGRPKRIAN